MEVDPHLLLVVAPETVLLPVVISGPQVLLLVVARAAGNRFRPCTISGSFWPWISGGSDTSSDWFARLATSELLVASLGLVSCDG